MIKIIKDVNSGKTPKENTIYPALGDCFPIEMTLNVCSNDEQ